MSVSKLQWGDASSNFLKFVFFLNVMLECLLTGGFIFHPYYIRVYFSPHQLLFPHRGVWNISICLHHWPEYSFCSDNDAVTVCVQYLRVSQQLFYATDRFYGMFGYSTLLFFLSYQHWVSSSQQGAHTAKLILKIDAESNVWKLRPWWKCSALMMQLVSCCYKHWPEEGSMDLINNALTVRSTSGHRQACKN